jgi:hypothetical protein
LLCHQDWELRYSVCLQIPAVCAVLGSALTSECLLPCIEAALVDVQELVVGAALCSLWTLVQMDLLSEAIVVSAVKGVVPLMLYPCSAIRCTHIHVFVCVVVFGFIFLHSNRSICII